MQQSLITEIYLKQLGKQLERIYIDQHNNVSYSFERLFQVLRIDEGQYAFLSYQQRMKQARETYNPTKDSFYRERISSSILSKTDLSALPVKESSSSEHQGQVNSQDSGPSIEPKKEKLKSDERRNLSNQLNSSNRLSEFYRYENQRQGEEIIHLLEKSDTQIIDDEDKKTTDNPITIDTPLAGDKEHSVDLLEVEPDQSISKSSLIINKADMPSRVLAIASAGHGKTTLLKRIALFYCRKSHVTEEDIKVESMYQLTTHFIPCLVKLRELKDSDFTIESEIIRNVTSVFDSVPKDDNDVIRIIKHLSLVDSWVELIKPSLLLLIDGLDELTPAFRLKFLSQLENYLSTNPNVRVIMTTRVAGLNENGVRELLGKMRFRGRSIIPLVEEEAKSYAQKWITETQPNEQQESLLRTMNQVLTQKRFEFLKEYIHTPLELLFILRQIASDTLSLNRHQLFHDMLWEMVTNHVDISQKMSVFEDTMTFMSFIAYQMQITGKLSISNHEIGDMMPKLEHLSFQTSIFAAREQRTILNFLDQLSANVGIIDRDDRESDIVYVFPTRAYQEFLCSYAICHLRLWINQRNPEPIAVLNKYVNNNQWIGVFNFALSDLASDDLDLYEQFISVLFEKTADSDYLKSIIEVNHPISIKAASILCYKHFNSKRLTKSQSELLQNCLGIHTNYSFINAIKNLFRQTDSLSKDSFLEAYSMTSFIQTIQSGESPSVQAKEMINSKSLHTAKAGAMMLSIQVRSLLKEDLQEYRDLSEKDLRIEQTLINQLTEWAHLSRSTVFIETLCNLWISGCQGHELIKTNLDYTFSDILIDSLNGLSQEAEALCLLGKKSIKNPYYYEFIALFYSLGTIPYHNHSRTEKPISSFVSYMIESFYLKSRVVLEIDQVALAIAKYHYNHDLDELMGKWIRDICKGVPSSMVTRNPYGLREQNHFSLIKEDFQKQEKLYLDNQAQINEIDQITSKYYPTLTQSEVFRLFRQGKTLESARHCLENLGNELSSSITNLAFLIRYAKLTPEDLGIDEPIDISILLSTGVSDGNPYAIINQALHELDRGDQTTAHTLLSRLTRENWEDITLNFWLPELWITRNHDREGALVCVLAHKYAGLNFDDLEEMIQAIQPFDLKQPSK